MFDTKKYGNDIHQHFQTLTTRRDIKKFRRGMPGHYGSAYGIRNINTMMCLMVADEAVTHAKDESYQYTALGMIARALPKEMRNYANIWNLCMSKINSLRDLGLIDTPVREYKMEITP